MPSVYIPAREVEPFCKSFGSLWAVPRISPGLPFQGIDFSDLLVNNPWVCHAGIVASR